MVHIDCELRNASDSIDLQHLLLQHAQSIIGAALDCSLHVVAGDI